MMLSNGGVHDRLSRSTGGDRLGRVFQLRSSVHDRVSLCAISNTYVLWCLKGGLYAAVLLLLPVSAYDDHFQENMATLNPLPSVALFQRSAKDFSIIWPRTTAFEHNLATTDK